MQCCVSCVGLDLSGGPDWPAPGPVPDAWGSGGADAESLRQPGESRLFAATAMARFPVAAGLGRPDASLKVVTRFQFPLLSERALSLSASRGFVEWYVRMRFLLHAVSRCHRALCSVPRRGLWRCCGGLGVPGPRSAPPETPRLRSWAAGIQAEPLTRGCSGRSALVLVL